MKKLVCILSISFLVITFFSSCEKEDSSSCTSQCENSVQCNGTTQSGSTCQNITLNCCGYCYLHTSQN